MDASNDACRYKASSEIDNEYHNIKMFNSGWKDCNVVPVYLSFANSLAPSVSL